MTPLQKAAWNKAIRDSVDALLHKGGYNEESSARHQLAMMNFDVESEQAQAVEPFEIEFPDYHGQAMRYGLEDRNITDRYEAMRYGWDQALERVEDCLPEKLYTHPAPTPEPTVKQSLMVHASAEDYMRYKYGAYRGHFAWRELEEAYIQGRYDELQAQGPIPWPDDAPEVHYQRGYAVALSDAEEAIDDECRERVVTASDCIEIIRNLGAETEATADDADLIVAKLNALSEAQQVAVPMTDQQIAEAYYQGTCQPLHSQDKTFAFAFSRAIEAFHGITGAKP